MRILFFLFFSLISMQLHSQDFQQYRWENRLLLIVDQSDQQAKRQQQLVFLQKEAAGLIDRKLKVFSLSKKGMQEGMQDVSKWKAMEIPARFKTQQSLKVFLIGLDGGIKATYDAPIMPQSIFDIIDTMPMRRAELNSRN